MLGVRGAVGSGRCPELGVIFPLPGIFDGAAEYNELALVVESSRCIFSCRCGGAVTIGGDCEWRDLCMINSTCVQL